MGLIDKLNKIAAFRRLVGAWKRFKGPKVQLRLNTVRWFGNSYGGFGVDVSRVPQEPVVYSFGVGTDISFDRQLISEFGAQVYAFDPTPKSVRWVEEKVSEPNFHFYPYGLSDKNETAQFHLPANDVYVSGSVVAHSQVKTQSIDVEMRTLATLAAINGHTRIDILKMDIEGSEFACVPDILNTPIEITQICVEVHQRFFADGKTRLRGLIAALNGAGFYLAHVSDYAEELTFVKTLAANPTRDV